LVDTAFANKPTLRFAVGFHNTDGGVGSSPGFAVDEIEIRGVSTDSLICDSIAQLTITVIPTFRDTLVASQCDSFNWRGTTYSTTGFYSDTVIGGCDSIFNLDLTINTNPVTPLVIKLCAGDSVVMNNGQVLTSSGIYFDTISTLPCDSIVSYSITALPANLTTNFDTVCGNQPYTLPGGGVPSGSGIYFDTLVAANSCDSIIITNLIVGDTSSSTLSLVGCDSVISPSGKIWRTTGTFADTLINSAGCDSLMTIAVTINTCLLYTSPSPRDRTRSRMPSSA